MATIRLYNPEGLVEAGHHETPAPRLDTVLRKKIGLLDNAKPAAAEFMQRLGEVLQNRYQAQIVLVQKSSAALPMKPEHEAALLQCDAVITGFGD